jgi:methyl coenzyme M reductase alpha subunit
MDPDTREGSNFARIYDIVQYPTIIATADDGKEQHRWAGTPLPLINDVSYYTLSN